MHLLGVESAGTTRDAEVHVESSAHTARGRLREWQAPKTVRLPPTYLPILR